MNQGIIQKTLQERKTLRQRVNGFFGQATSGNVSVTVEAAPVERVLTLSADKTTVKAGYPVTFTGGYTVAGYAAGGDVTLFKDGVSTGLTVHTGEYGSYSLTWLPTSDDAGQTFSFYAEVV